MPTPYGFRGGMAFGADELRVLRRALAVALDPAPLPDDAVRDCLTLARSVDEADQEAGRLRAFLVADLARYRSALPGSLSGYLELLQDALAVGYQARPDDLAALRALRGNPAAAALLERCRGARVLTLVGAAEDPREPERPEPKEPNQPDRPKPGTRPAPGRPMPKPSEVFPPRRRPAPPPEELAAG